MTEKTPELKQAIEAALSLSPLDKVRLVEQIMGTLELEFMRQDQLPRRSLYGLWKGISISEEEIAEARQAMWDKFPRSDI